MIKGSLTDQPDAKPYARHAARRALNSYLKERGIAAHAEACPQNAESHRVIYQLPNPPPMVSIVTMARGAAFEGTDYGAVEITKVQAGAAGMNAAASRAHGEVLLFANRSVEALEPGSLNEIVSQVVRPEVGAVGARLCTRQGALEDGGLILVLGGIAAPAFRGLPRAHPGYFNPAWLQQNCSAVSAACLAIEREVFQKIGGFDAENLPNDFYDIDLCPPASSAKPEVVWTPYANLTLSDSGPGEKANASQETSYMQKRWGELLRRDPYYNPNLSLDLPGFTLAIPPRTRR